MNKYIVVDNLDCELEEKVKEAGGEVFLSSLEAYVYAGIVNNIKFNMINDKYENLRGKIKIKTIADKVYNVMSKTVFTSLSVDELMGRIGSNVRRVMSEELFIISTIDIWGQFGKYFKIDNRIISSHTTIHSEAGLMPILKIYDKNKNIIDTFDFKTLGLSETQVIEIMGNAMLEQIK